MRVGLIRRKNISQPLAALTREDERLSSGLTLIDLSFRRDQGKRHPGAERCGVVTAETAHRGRRRCFVDVSLCGRVFLEFNRSDETKKLLDCSHGAKVQQASASLRRHIDWLRRQNYIIPMGLVKNNWEDAQDRRTMRGARANSHLLPHLDRDMLRVRGLVLFPGLLPCR